MEKLKWLAVICLSPVVALAFAFAICGALVVALTAELHQQLWDAN